MRIPHTGWVAPFGHPRINACSRLPMAFRSVPRPSSPPGAKASTECPSHTRYTSISRSRWTHHAQKPSSDDSRQGPGFRDQTTPATRPLNHETTIISSHTKQNTQNSYNNTPLNTRRPTAGAQIPNDRSPGQTCSPTTPKDQPQTPNARNPDT